MTIVVEITADNGNFIGEMSELETSADWRGAIVENGRVYIDIDGELLDA